jgi:hypothetical protein
MPTNEILMSEPFDFGIAIKLPSAIVSGMIMGLFLSLPISFYRDRKTKT